MHALLLSLFTVLALLARLPAQDTPHPHLLVLVGDSLMAGIGSSSAAVPAGTAVSIPNVKVWGQWFDPGRFGAPATNAWTPLVQDCALSPPAASLIGPGLVFHIAQEYMAQVAPSFLFVILLAVPGSDVIPRMSQANTCYTNGGGTWDPTVGDRPWTLLRDSYLTPALAALPRGQVHFAGVVFSFGNNMSTQPVSCGNTLQFVPALDRFLAKVSNELGLTSQAYATGFIPALDPAAQPFVTDNPSLADCQLTKARWTGAYPRGAMLDCRLLPPGNLPAPVGDPYHLTAKGYLDLGKTLGATHATLVQNAILPIIP